MCLLPVSFSSAKQWCDERFRSLLRGVRAGAFDEGSVEVVEGLSASLKLNNLDGQPIVSFPDAKPIETLNVVDTADLVHKNDDS